MIYIIFACIRTFRDTQRWRQCDPGGDSSLCLFFPSTCSFFLLPFSSFDKCKQTTPANYPPKHNGATGFPRCGGLIFPLACHPRLQAPDFCSCCCVTEAFVTSPLHVFLGDCLYQWFSNFFWHVELHTEYFLVQLLLTIKKIQVLFLCNKSQRKSN